MIILFLSLTYDTAQIPGRTMKKDVTVEALPTPAAASETREIKSMKKTEVLPRTFMPDVITIPSISVKAKIKEVAVRNDGQMDVPQDTEVAGLLYPGTLPGEKGNVIIDGHVDSYTGPAVFFNLKKLRRGDPIIVSDVKGNKLTYTVDSMGIFTPKEAPIERIFGKSNEYRLNLITCTGRYSRKKKEHELRLVIFTKLGGEL